ncbi:unnamed protein product [Durusdinium trenchii]|uniref:Peptidase A1 domain-containing protein n=1 Tax=Durusdinium trenchii TaxID=1381693 RepID=A0ABP0I6H1_9DINO
MVLVITFFRLSLQSLLIFCASAHLVPIPVYGNLRNDGYYFLDLWVGTPPQRVSVMMSLTGSPLTAFACSSCERCAQHMDPWFQLNQSSTAEILPCADPRCHRGCGNRNLATSNAPCEYEQRYAEGSSIRGWWFEDVVRAGSQLIGRKMMGCHSEEKDIFSTLKANGILQLAPGISDTLLAERDADVIAVCLADYGGIVTMGGPNWSFHRGRPKYIKMKQRMNSSIFAQGRSEILVPLTSISIGWHVVPIHGETTVESGTTRTYFSSSAYDSIRKHIESFCRHRCGLLTAKRSCWITKRLQYFPALRMNFGHTFRWAPSAYLYARRPGHYCYAFEDDGPSGRTILGGSWMLHQELIFDFRQGRLGVVPAECPRHFARPIEVALASLDTGDSPCGDYYALDD